MMTALSTQILHWGALLAFSHLSTSEVQLLPHFKNKKTVSNLLKDPGLFDSNQYDIMLLSVENEAVFFKVLIVRF